MGRFRHFQSPVYIGKTIESICPFLTLNIYSLILKTGKLLIDKQNATCRLTTYLRNHAYGIPGWDYVRQRAFVESIVSFSPYGYEAETGINSDTDRRSRRLHGGQAN